MLAGCNNSDPTIKGTVEQQIVSHFAESSGKIISSPIEQGAPVKTGDILAVIDTTQDEFAIEQLKAVLERRQATLDELLAGADNNDLKAVQNNINIAQESYNAAMLSKEKADKDLADAKYLYDNEALNQQTLDNLTHQAELARSALVAAKLQIDTARSRYESLAEGASVYKITMASADIAQTESQIRQCEDKIAKATIRALTDGVLVTKNYVSGDIAAPGFNIADVADEKSKYVLAYWPEELLSRINYGQSVTFTAGDIEYSGVVAFIDVSKEYTPKEDQTAANKNKSSMRVKIRLPEDTPLKQGETVFIHIP